MRDSFQLSAEQQRFIGIAHTGKNILVDACIGSGKTTAIQRLCDELPKSKRILYLTYNRLLKIDARARIQSANTTVTNYHGFEHPTLFDWVGMVNFSNVFDVINSTQKANTFFSIAGWTLLWAFAATFSNYILGMIVALMINKKGIKFKGVFRTMFVITIAVPQFVSLLLMSQMLTQEGAFNILLGDLFNGGVNPKIDFLGGSAWGARLTVILVNCWVGIPYTILSMSGILMNIPEDLYESARIDGATPVKTFTKITLPYMIFVTTPQLITQFVGNINNFNVIFLLTGGKPANPDLYGAGDTDILVTWLYQLSMGEKKDYGLASAIGILVFIICATLSLIIYNNSKSMKDEEAFS